MKTQPNQFYRNQYYIAIVEDDMFEFIIDVYDNVHQLAKALNRPVSSLNSSLHRFLNKENNYMYIKGRRYKVEFIPIGRNKKYVKKTK
jgi:hypothetical protein